MFLTKFWFWLLAAFVMKMVKNVPNVPSVPNMFVNFWTSCYRTSNGLSFLKSATNGRILRLGPRFIQQYHLIMPDFFLNAWNFPDIFSPENFAIDGKSCHFFRLFCNAIHIIFTLIWSNRMSYWISALYNKTHHHNITQWKKMQIFPIGLDSWFRDYLWYVL